MRLSALLIILTTVLFTGIARAENFTQVGDRTFVRVRSEGRIFQIFPAHLQKPPVEIKRDFRAKEIFNYQDRLWAYSEDGKLYRQRSNQWLLEGSNVLKYIVGTEFLLALRPDKSLWIHRGNLQMKIRVGGHEDHVRALEQFEKLAF
jgi:hypothetical protein